MADQGELLERVKAHLLERFYDGGNGMSYEEAKEEVADLFNDFNLDREDERKIGHEKLDALIRGDEKQESFFYDGDLFHMQNLGGKDT